MTMNHPTSKWASFARTHTHTHQISVEEYSPFFFAVPMMNTMWKLVHLPSSPKPRCREKSKRATTPIFHRTQSWLKEQRLTSFSNQNRSRQWTILYAWKPQVSSSSSSLLCFVFFFCLIAFQCWRKELKRWELPLCKKLNFKTSLPWMLQVKNKWADTEWLRAKLMASWTMCPLSSKAAYPTDNSVFECLFAIAKSFPSFLGK